MTAYASAAEYRAVAGMTDTAKDADILTDLTAVSRYLDGALGRQFTQDTTPVERIYIPASTKDYIWTDDMAAAPTLIRIDTDRDGTYSTTLDAADYELWPLNANRGPEPWPWMKIQLVPWGDRRRFFEGVRVEVTAQYGWPAIPEAVQRATIHLTAILRLETPRATRRIPELGEVVEASRDAQTIIKRLTEQYKVWRV